MATPSASSCSTSNLQEFISPRLEQPFFKVDETYAAELDAFRRDYQAYRLGAAKGARGEITSTMKKQYLSNAEVEKRVLKLFRPSDDPESERLSVMVDHASRAFVEAEHFTTPNVTEQEIANRFRKCDMAIEPADVKGYFHDLIHNVVEDSIHTSCPQMIGHMTSALPNWSPMLSKLMVSMNQNVVKTETAKTVTFLEREALAQLHKRIYEFPNKFYQKHVQNPGSMMGLFTSGGTLANVSALWIARNHCIGPDLDEDGKTSFAGVEREGLPKALKHYGYEDSIIIGSALMHYSMNKAADVLGMGVNSLVKIPVDENYRVDLNMMEERIQQAQRDNVLVTAIVGICGTTETGAIDSLEDMANLAAKYNIHFHVDAAWGGPCIFSTTHRFKCKGIELADSITLDGHKQLWMPMGSGMVFLKDPYKVLCVRKVANYIIRKESYDLGKFTIDGSRGAGALFLHANLQLLGLRGYEVLIDRTVRVAQYMARRILRSRNYELLVKPHMNILLYRWIPSSLRDKVWQGELNDEDQEFIDEMNRQLQTEQKMQGRTFVSRTTINAPKYDHKPIVGLRVVIGNPLTTEDDIDAVLADQARILEDHSITKDVSPTEIIQQNSKPSIEAEGTEGGRAGHEDFKKYWEKIWEDLPRRERFLFGDDMDQFFDSLSTPDCFLYSQVSPVMRPSEITGDA